MSILILHYNITKDGVYKKPVERCTVRSCNNNDLTLAVSFM